MIETGLVSISFRNLSVEDVVKTAVQAGLAGIEWGADIHVPAGDLEAAEYAKKLTEEAGLQVFAYGSYYRAGDNADPEKDFLPVLNSACVLGAPVIRVWAGSKWSWSADEAYVEKVIEDTRIICDMAAEKGIKICYEYHGWTLTDNRFSALDIKARINKPNMFLYWQPNFCLTEADNLLALEMVLPHMEYVHVFFWDANGNKFPLEDGREIWKKFVEKIASDSRDHKLLFEFVKDGLPEQLCRDADTLRDMVRQLS